MTFFTFALSYCCNIGPRLYKPVILLDFLCFLDWSFWLPSFFFPMCLFDTPSHYCNYYNEFLY